MENKIILTNIQRFSLHDGPGIRTTVFLKGCSLQCPWCSNPENLIFLQQKYIKDGVDGIYGRYYEPEQLYEEVLKDKAFYCGELSDYNIQDPFLLKKIPGGVTFSGGEALLQIRQLQSILEKLKSEHIHTAVETSLFVPDEYVLIAIKLIDLFYVDIKILDKDACKENLHGDFNQFLKNIKLIFESRKPVVIRIPVISGYTDGKDNRTKVIKMIKYGNGNILKIELIKEHSLGINKYHSLIAGGNDINVPEYKGVSDELMQEYKQQIIDTINRNIPIEVCSI